MSLRNGGADLSPLWHLTLTPDLHGVKRVEEEEQDSSDQH